ncbi:MAG: hypothetical protein M3680_37155, partial [Myxococcota bacterium]|nr:hypothetical protein [Myxococcota bacterium]
MSAMRADNKRLTETVTDLRSDRRSQERKLRDLQRQLDLLRAQVATSVIDGSMPSLPVEVVGPPPGAAASSGSSTEARVVGIADDGTEIVYEGDAAAGKVATMEDDEPIVRRAPARSELAPVTPAGRGSSRRAIAARSARPQ